MIIIIGYDECVCVCVLAVRLVLSHYNLNANKEFDT